MNMRVAPNNAINIYVTAQRWFWSFQYPNGQTSSNELVVPVNQPVRLTMSSKDLIHSFFSPQFRIKQDVLPNRYTVTWFEATKTGTYDLYCAEYCGTGHSGMLGKIRVVPEDEYQKWLLTGGIDPSKMSLAEYGARALSRPGVRHLPQHRWHAQTQRRPLIQGHFWPRCQAHHRRQRAGR